MGCGDFDSQNRYTALMYAACMGYTESVRLLIDSGADKDGNDEVRVGS